MLRPVAAAVLVAVLAPAWAAPPDGAKVYNQNCAMCHNAGLAKSPKFGDKDAWAPRLALSRDALLQSVLQGKGAMPPKGGNSKLGEEEVAAALAHLVASAQ